MRNSQLRLCSSEFCYDVRHDYWARRVASAIVITTKDEVATTKQRQSDN